MNQTPKPILLVEDDPNDVALFQRAVRKAGIGTEVQVVEDGEEAMRWLLAAGKSFPMESDRYPHLILLDLKIPRKSGLEVLEWLRQQPILRRLPVVVFTSSREPSDISRAYDLGANSYLVKPVSFDQLKEMVRALHRYWIEWNERPELQ